MAILDMTTARRMASELPFGERLLRLESNPQLGEEAIKSPFRYVSPSVRGSDFLSNCYGTATYVLGLEDDILAYFVESRADVLRTHPEFNYTVFPDRLAEHPGYVGYKHMEEFLEKGGRMSGAVREPLPGDLVMFSARPSLSRFDHSGVFVGVLNGCNVMFHQEDKGMPFRLGTVEDYAARLEETRQHVMPSFYRKIES